MTNRERMVAGLPYQDNVEGLDEERLKCNKKIFELNNTSPAEREKMNALLKEILGKTGEKFYMETPFHCDYGWNIEIGENFYSNYNLVILDVAKVTIGENVMLAPNVSIYTAGHPVYYEARNTGYEYGIPINIGNNVWVGGNSVILPGVSIGDNSVIGAGSVVTRDVPPNVVAAGNPCRVLREITKEDKKYYFKNRPFDIDIWQ